MRNKNTFLIVAKHSLFMKKIAIIGSGPAGMAVAMHLSGKAEIIVFDELSEFGGMLAYGFPEFRMPLESVKKRIEGLKEKGIKFERKILSIAPLA